MATYICFQIAKYLQPLTLQPIHIICKFNFEYKNNLNVQVMGINFAKKFSGILELYYDLNLVISLSF